MYWSLGLKSTVLLRGGRTSRRWAQGADVQSQGSWPWRSYWDLNPFSHCSLIGHVFPLQWTLLPQADSNGAKQLCVETMSQNKPFFLLSWLTQVFCHSNRDLTNTGGDTHITEIVGTFQATKQKNSANAGFQLIKKQRTTWGF
jgi:hypothetical protein